MSPHELSTLFALQIAVILITCRLVGGIAKQLGQPLVVGEMIAGIVLGPSGFGLCFPEWSRWLFAEQSRPVIYCASQLGLTLYMFQVGMEFRMDLFRSHLKTAASVSIAGMFFPFVLGAGLGAWLVKQQGFFPDNVPAWDGMLFLGTSMCITAFPMLARIIDERRLAGTTLGTLALAAGAIGDAAAWCLLALILSSFEANASIAVWAIGGGISFVIVSLLVVRPLLNRWERQINSSKPLPFTVLSKVLIVVLAGAWFTDMIGIYAVFGAFVLGCVMPRGRLSDEVTRMIEPVVSTLFVPLFFTYTGLNTRLDLVATPMMLFVTVLVLLVACLGKAGACWAAARLTGTDAATARGVGVLMNARGLMELIILNIGLERGLILPQLFSIMVIMAVATTLMTSPLFELVYGKSARKRGDLDALETGHQFRASGIH